MNLILFGPALLINRALSAGVALRICSINGTFALRRAIGFALRRRTVVVVARRRRIVCAGRRLLLCAGRRRVVALALRAAIVHTYFITDTQPEGSTPFYTNLVLFWGGESGGGGWLVALNI